MGGKNPPPGASPHLPRVIVPKGGLGTSDRRITYSKVFRWQTPKGDGLAPKQVEVAGSFTEWQKVPLVHDAGQGTWQITIHDIPGNRTHHYMLLVDGLPAADSHSDGYALPQGPIEEQHAIMTPRGARVFMLFAQTK